MFVRERDHLWRLWCILSGKKLLLDEYLEVRHLVLFWINIYYRVIRCSFLTFLSYRDLIQNFSFLLFQWKSPTEVLLRTQRNYDSRLVGMIQYYFSCDGILWFYFTVEITGVIFLVGPDEVVDFRNLNWNTEFCFTAVWLSQVVERRTSVVWGVQGQPVFCFLPNQREYNIAKYFLFLIFLVYL